MEDIGLGRLGELLDGELSYDERIQYNGRVRVYGEGGVRDKIFGLDGEATITPSEPADNGTSEEFELSGQDATFYFRPETVDHQLSHVPGGRRADEKLTVRLADPAGYRMIINDSDCNRIVY